MSRFSEPQHPDFRAINASLAFDRRLWPYDIAQSRAHAAMLASIGVIGDAERDELLAGLEAVSAELAAGRFAFAPDDEDIHMAIERRLTEIVGSRRRQAAHRALAQRPGGDRRGALRARRRRRGTRGARRASSRCSSRGPRSTSTGRCPGYTHLQRAQPVYLGHHLLAYVWMFLRDRGRFEAVIEAARVLPLGAGALAGVNFATDRERLAAELGFASIAANSIDAVSNRDFALDYLAAAATVATHLSRLGAELVLWSSEEFGFCALSDAWSSGSSIMPQKKNPDAAELLRAKAPRILAHHAALHGVLHGLPLTYSKDMQEDKEHLFDAVDTLALSLAAARGMLATVTFKRERLAAGRLRRADRRGRRRRPARAPRCALPRGPRDGRRSRPRGARRTGARSRASATSELAELAPALDASALRALLQGDSWLESKVSAGGTALVRVREQLAAARAALAADVSAPLRGRGVYGRACPDRLRRPPWRDRRRDRRDRGLSPVRAGLPRLRRAHAAHDHALRAARAGLRVPLLRDPRDAERRRRAGGDRRGGADPRARAAGGHRADARSAAGASASRSCARARES